VSHNLVTVEHLCPRALLLVGGRLIFDGATEETVSKYLHLLPHAERELTPGVFNLAAGERAGGDYVGKLFKRLELRPRGGPPSDTIRMGDPLQIEITVTGLDAEPDANVHVTVGSSTSECIFRMTARMVPLQVAQERRPEEKIVINIPSLPLTPGDYHLNVGVHDKRAKLLDEVRHAAEFSVIPADVLGNGYQFTFRDGHVRVPWEWEVRPANGELPSKGDRPSVRRG
jgi:lipopolysaccharide transport system ATP-binding protein